MSDWICKKARICISIGWKCFSPRSLDKKWKVELQMNQSQVVILGEDGYTIYCLSAKSKVCLRDAVLHGNSQERVWRCAFQESAVRGIKWCLAAASEAVRRRERRDWLRASLSHGRSDRASVGKQQLGSHGKHPQRWYNLPQRMTTPGQAVE